MLAFVPTKLTQARTAVSLWSLLTLGAMFCLPLSAFAQPGGGLGCLVNAGISPQEVCINDHIFLGGNPTVPPALAGEVQSIEWSVLSGDPNVEFSPNAFVPNPQVYVSEPTTFQVTLTLTDGSVCENDITLLPIEQPTMELEGSWVQCDGGTDLWFYNTTPSNSVNVSYDVNWGDGQSSFNLPFASAFEHAYQSQGAYVVTVTATLGSCLTTETIDVFLGSPPDPIDWSVPPTVCSDGLLEFEWSNLADYPLGSSWQLYVDGSLEFSGLVNTNTTTDFSWTFPPAESCLDAVQSHTIYAELVNLCMPSVSSQAGVQVALDPLADLVLVGDSCELVQLSVGSGVECPSAFSIQWDVTQDGNSISPQTENGDDDDPYWSFSLPPGEYEATLNIGTEACGYDQETIPFCIEMPAPSHWGNPGLYNGSSIHLCAGESVDLWVDSLESVCGGEISTSWTLSPLSGDSQMSAVEALDESNWSHGWLFSEPGLYLVELDGTTGCGALNLFAEVVVTELPTLNLTSYDAGQPDSILCRGDEVAVVAHVNGYGLENGAYTLQWELLETDGTPHPSAQSYLFGDSTLVVQSSASAPADDILVAVHLMSACGMVHDTLTLEVEDDLVPEFWLIQGNEGPFNGQFQEYLQCTGDTLVIGFDVPGAAEVNVYSQTLDLWNIVFTEGTSQGELHWLSNGLNWDFQMEFVSEQGCTSYETVGFRSVFPPEIYVDDAALVCLGDTSEFAAVVFPGSTDSLQSITWYHENSQVATGLSMNAALVMSECWNGPVTCVVTDQFGCQASDQGIAPVSCPQAQYPESVTCSAVGDTVCVVWTSSGGSEWLYPADVWLNDDSTGTCALVDSTGIHFEIAWTEFTSIGCPVSHYGCWAVGGLDSLGECMVDPCTIIPPPPPPPPPCETFTCLDSTACNFGLSACCLDSCLFPEDIGPNSLDFDTLEFCQSWELYSLTALTPWIGTWSGRGVQDNSNPYCAGTAAWLDLSEADEWDIYFSGGVGTCVDVDTVHVIVHDLPSYTGPNAFSECHGTELDLGQYTEGNPQFCWSFHPLGSPIGGCDSSGVWVVNGSGYVAWSGTDVHGCTSLNTSIYIEDLGHPNAIAGNDTTLCSLPIPNAMQFEFGAPYALGCNPAVGSWEGEGASYDYFAEVWSEGNCLQSNEPWIDSLWTFTAPGLGEFEWIWTVVDCNGCVDQDTITITVIEPTPPVLPQLTFCMDHPVGPVTNQTDACWFGDGISPDFIFDPAVAGVGVHEWVVGIGEGSCALNDTVEVEIFGNPDFVLEGIGPWPCANEPYSMCIDIPDSAALPWSFDWSSFPPIEAVDSCSTSCCDIQNVDATNVTAVVTNIHGCTAEDSWVINLANSPDVELTDTLIFCNDGSMHPISSAPLGGDWSGPHVTSNGVFHAEENGEFTLTYTYTNAESCSDTDSLVVVVTELPAPTIATPPSDVCIGSPFLLQTSDDGVWSGPGISNTGMIQQSEPGSYMYYLTTGVGSCLVQDSVEITFWTLPEIDLPIDTMLCAGNPIEIELSEENLESESIVLGFGFGCEGLTGTFPSFEFAPEATCDFSVVVEDEHGCIGFHELNVIVPMPVPSYAGPPEVMCIGETMSLSGQIIPGCATDVLWSGDIVDPFGNVSAEGVGLHWLELSYTDCYGCHITGWREVLVLDVPLVEFAWEDSMVCAGQEVDASIHGYGGSLSYEWLWDDGSSSLGLDTPWVAINDGSSVLSLEAGVVAFNMCGSDTAWAPIQVNPILLVSPSSSLSPTALVNDTLCAPVELEFFADAPGATEWVWSDWMTPDSLNPGGATFSMPTVDVETNFELSVQAGIGESLCSTPLQWTITVVPEPVASIDAGVTFYCGEALYPDIEFDASHGLAAWDWSGGELPGDFPENWSIDQNGETTLSLTVTSQSPGASCSASETISLELYPQPVAGFEVVSDSVLCAPGTFEILDTSEDAVEIAWYVDYVGGWLDPGETLNLLLPVAGQYGMVWAALGEGGCNDTLFVYDVFEVLPSPDAGIWSSQPAFVPWSMEGTEFVFNDVSLGGDSTIWTIGDSTIVDESILSFFYEDPGIYAISQQVYNEYGCEDTVSFRFEIIDELEIHIPTAFTPNGDDINDVWKPVIAGESRIEAYHLQVISRSHQVMFETFDPSRGWDALDVPRPEKLEDVQNSLFMYVLRVLPEATPLEPEPKWLEYTGHVMIVD